MKAVKAYMLSTMMALSVSAHAKMESAYFVADTIPNVADTTANDTIQQLVSMPKKKKRNSWFWKFYRFADSVLSPPRDSNYIDVQTYNWCALVQLTGRFESFEMDGGDNFRMRITPDFRFRVGPFFGWRFAFLGYNVDLKSVFINDNDTDLSGSVYSAAFGLDLFYRRVGGSYNIKYLSAKGKDYTSSLFNKPVDGINIGTTRVSFYYIFNYKHYSHQAAFSQTNRQLLSAGSPILGLQYAHNTASVDWMKLYNMVEKVNNTQMGVEAAAYANQKNDEISVTGGYGYNWVFAKNWLAAGEVTGALGYLIQKVHVDEDKNQIYSSGVGSMNDFYRKNLAFSGIMRLAMLYNNGPWFAGTQAVMFYYRYGNGSVMTRNLLGTVYLYVGCNF